MLIRQQSVLLFAEVVEKHFPKLEKNFQHNLARALWLQHLLILGFWSFDRSRGSLRTEEILKQSNKLWKSLPGLLKVPGFKSAINLVLQPLFMFEMGEL